MSLYTIADLHLSLCEGTNKAMDVFGNRWTDYTSKLEKNWRAIINPDDTVIIPGDISWALSLDESLLDLKFLDSLPGKKIIGKGNHDFWWSTMNKMRNFFAEHGITTIEFLHNNAYFADGYNIAGTRGWFYDQKTQNYPDNADFDKLSAREAARLKASLEAAKKLRDENSGEILVFLHFPPVWNGFVCKDIVGLLDEYGVTRCYFGHIHGAYELPRSFLYGSVEFVLISADFLNFVPRIIAPPECG